MYFSPTIPILFTLLCSMSIIVSMFEFFFFKQKTAYELRISDWSSDVCSSGSAGDHGAHGTAGGAAMQHSMRDFSVAPQVKRDPSVQTISPMPADRKSTRLNSSH